MAEQIVKDWNFKFQHDKLGRMNEPTHTLLETRFVCHHKETKTKMSTTPIEERFSLIDFVAGVIAGLMGLDSLLWGGIHVAWEILSNYQNWIRLWQLQPRFRVGQGDSIMKSQTDNLMAFAGWYLGYYARLRFIWLFTVSRRYWRHRQRLNRFKNTDLAITSTSIPSDPITSPPTATPTTTTVAVKNS